MILVYWYNHPGVRKIIWKIKKERNLRKTGPGSAFLEHLEAQIFKIFLLV